MSKFEIRIWKLGTYSQSKSQRSEDIFGPFGPGGLNINRTKYFLHQKAVDLTPRIFGEDMTP